LRSGLFTLAILAVTAILTKFRLRLRL
jgi:hypothetical protein